MNRRWIIFVLILALLYLYTGFEMTLLLPGHKLVAWSVGSLVFGLAIVWQFLYRSDAEALDAAWFRVLAWAGSLSMGLWATFVLLSIPQNLLNLCFGRVVLPPLWGFVLAAGITSWGFAEVITGPKVKSVRVPVRGLAPGFHGLKIAQISDLHIGPTIRRAYVEEVVRRVMRLAPDLIAITGDMVDGTPETLARYCEPLTALKAPLGVYYVTGNHEYYWGAEAWINKAKELGFVPLINENRVVEHAGNWLLVGGVTDTSAGEFVGAHATDPQAAGHTSQVCGFKLLLAHRPDSCVAAEAQGFDLQLSGHTHAGQFFPWSLLVRLAHKYYRGLNRHGRMWVYVNAGTGYWGPANRFGIPSEVTLLSLEAGR